MEILELYKGFFSVFSISSIFLITVKSYFYVKVSCFVTIDVLSESSVLYTKRLFQTADGRMAESRMGEEEACRDLKLEEMI